MSKAGPGGVYGADTWPFRAADATSGQYFLKDQFNIKNLCRFGWCES
jgi:hypothetical protein